MNKYLQILNLVYLSISSIVCAVSPGTRTSGSKTLANSSVKDVNIKEKDVNIKEKEVDTKKRDIFVQKKLTLSNRIRNSSAYNNITADDLQIIKGSYFYNFLKRDCIDTSFVLSEDIIVSDRDSLIRSAGNDAMVKTYGAFYQIYLPLIQNFEENIGNFSGKIESLENIESFSSPVADFFIEIAYSAHDFLLIDEKQRLTNFMSSVSDLLKSLEVKMDYGYLKKFYPLYKEIVTLLMESDSSYSSFLSVNAFIDIVNDSYVRSFPQRSIVNIAIELLDETDFLPASTFVALSEKDKQLYTSSIWQSCSTKVNAFNASYNTKTVLLLNNLRNVIDARAEELS